MSELTEYEVERQKKLEENAKLLASLGLGAAFGSKHRPKSNTRKRVPRPASDVTPRSRPQRIRLPRETKEALSSLSASHKRKANALSDDDDQDDSDSDFESIDFTELPAHASRKACERNGRIYDPINGSSCHQCRQKTLDAKVSCTNTLKNYRTGEHYACPLKMCFRCLPNRYGQDVSEQAKNGSWTCPKCLGTCNCSFCMKSRGLPPTGIAATRAKQQGFASVQDMLAARKQTSTMRKAVARVKSISAKITTTVNEIRKGRRPKRSLPSPPPSEDNSDTDTASQQIKREADHKTEGEQDEELDNEAKEEADHELDEEFVVSHIVSVHFKASSLLFRVRWLNYSPSDDTYQPYASVSELAAMDIFEAKNPTLTWHGFEISLQDAIRLDKDGKVARELAHLKMMRKRRKTEK